MSYDEIYGEFLTLDYDEKKEKLRTILLELDQKEYCQETLDLINDSGTSSHYLNSIYEAIMKPLSENKDTEEAKKQIKISLKNLKMDIVEKKNNNENIDDLLASID